MLVCRLQRFDQRSYSSAGVKVATRSGFRWEFSRHSVAHVSLLSTNRKRSSSSSNNGFSTGLSSRLGLREVVGTLA